VLDERYLALATASAALTAAGIDVHVSQSYGERPQSRSGSGRDNRGLSKAMKDGLRTEVCPCSRQCPDSLRPRSHLEKHFTAALQQGVKRGFRCDLKT
jgi:hypothetical protein